jgi:hypothetical protein
MTTHEKQRERVVADALSLVVTFRCNFQWRFGSNERLAIPARHFAPHVIDQATPCHTDQPTERLVRDAVAWPLIGPGDESFLHRILRCAEIIALTHNRTERLRRKLAQQALDTKIRRFSH